MPGIERRGLVRGLEVVVVVLVYIVVVTLGEGGGLVCVVSVWCLCGA